MRAGGKRGRGRKRRIKTIKDIDIRPLIGQLAVRDEAGLTKLDFEAVCVEGRMAKPKEILGLLGLDPERSRVLKRETLLSTTRIELPR